MSVSTSGRSTGEDLDYVTPEDIAIHLLRQSMSEGDLIALIREERKATGRKLVVQPKSHPKSTFTPLPPKREQPQPRVTPFVPTNPFEAKTQSARANTERFIGVDTPYESHRMDFNDGRTTDEDRRVAPFVPTCSSQAKDALQIKYYLNSPMATTIPLGQPQPQSERSRGTSRGGSSTRSGAQRS
ncbi:hypothetical protein VOLCADRAFT_86585 [Volvox carteri f. nagariensis]|uniref:Uncharacterized protein n=1 Tax=Volvox carteri f. nagariensis TaxID=3068 RepID=D8TJ24_VOLCA|nr:uncharacterized protein VOLCADRAFT_86585 [Volvox carteri f. nagariensis]EFJ52301.1 hypothetical protein VOLCADRAFT_86585 [Volvox carteri f. nagariensis]|eukprot:XP_002946374.1 hypothetical protein VOLCADRAFT_86585 [Volvox carteri f. nagariensis]